MDWRAAHRQVTPLTSHSFTNILDYYFYLWVCLSWTPITRHFVSLYATIIRYLNVDLHRSFCCSSNYHVLLIFNRLFPLSPPSPNLCLSSCTVSRTLPSFILLNTRTFFWGHWLCLFRVKFSIVPCIPGFPCPKKPVECLVTEVGFSSSQTLRKWTPPLSTHNSTINPHTYLLPVSTYSVQSILLGRRLDRTLLSPVMIPPQSFLNSCTFPSSV